MCTVGGFHGRTATDGARRRACPGLARVAEPGVHPCVRPRPGDFRGRAAGKAGALMAGAAVRETVTLAGRAERARVARAFVESGCSAPGTRAGADAALLVSCSAILRHSRSGVPGETVTVTVRAGDGIVRVEVHRPQRPREAARGLQLVAGMRRGGAGRRGGRTVTWFELSHGWHLRMTAIPP